MKATKMACLLLFAVLALVYIPGCKKDNNSTGNPATGTTVASDNAMSEYAYDDATVWSDMAMSSPLLKSTNTDTVYMGQCVLATLDLTSLPYTLTIDFGTSNCQCVDNNYRRGKIIVTFNGSYFETGTVINYAFQDYAINDYQVFGTLTVTNMGRNADQHLYWHVVVDGHIIKPNNAGTTYWSSDRYHEWVEGEGTWEPWDDAYLVRGTASGTTPEGVNYTVTTITDLKKKVNCQWIGSGVLNIQAVGWPLMTIDYGDGTCNNAATATVNGVVYNITI